MPTQLSDSSSFFSPERSNEIQPVKQKGRLLCLDGENGSVACRVHGELMASKLPHLSPYNTVELATRTLLRMKNLAAVRGIPGAGMVGPADYYNNLERPNQNLYTIAINKEGFPTFSQHTEDELIPSAPSQAIDDKYITTVNANWTSGSNLSVINKKKAEYADEQGNVFGESLFENPGILEIDGNEHVVLKPITTGDVDLSPFKARLVANNMPFQITKEKLAISDEYRAVSFLYEPGYAQRQIEHGGGLFLERHDFAQTITPIDENADGFVTLARWKTKTELELIAVKIPFGSTLIVDKDCIHGDATLKGMFLMCMTSNHVTMQTADTVFLKNPATKNNTTLSVDDSGYKECIKPDAIRAPRPLVLFNGYTEQDERSYKRATQNWSVIFNPFSRGYYKTESISMNVLGQFIAIVGIAAIATAFVALNLMTGGTAGVVVASLGAAALLTGAGIGLFSHITKNELSDKDSRLEDRSLSSSMSFA